MKTTAFRRARSLVDYDVPTWHDGNILDFAFSGPLIGKLQPNLIISTELYPDIGPEFPRYFFKITAKRVFRFQLLGNVPKLLSNSGAGNIRSSYLDFSENTETLIVDCFGGHIEVEAECLLIADQVDKTLQKIRK